MKRILLAAILTLCIFANIIVLSSCDDDPVSEIVATYGEYVDEKDSISLGEYTYGENTKIDQEIAKIKFYGILADNSKKEIGFKKFKSTYEHADEVYDGKPTRYITGEWTVKLSYQDKEYSVYFDVAQSSNGAFTVEIEKSSWKYGEDLPNLRIKNPDGKIVAPSSDGELLPDDTNLRSGTPCCLGFKKDFYDTLGSKKNDVDFLWGVYSSHLYKDDVVVGYNNKLSYHPGEYVLVLFDAVGTYNYIDIVCTTQFNVTE